MKLSTQQIIDLAQKHVNNGAAMQSSAALCLEDALAQQAKGEDINARTWAQMSLKYSVGILHPDFQASKEK